MLEECVRLKRLTARRMRRWWRGPGVAWAGAIVLSYGALAYSLHILSTRWLAQPTPYPWWAYLLPSPCLVLSAGWLHAASTCLRETEEMTEQVAAPQSPQLKRAAIIVAFAQGLWLGLVSFLSYIAYTHCVIWIAESLPTIEFRPPPAWNYAAGKSLAADGWLGVLAPAHLAAWLTAMASHRCLRDTAPQVILAMYIGPTLALFLAENNLGYSLAYWALLVPYHAILGLALCSAILLLARKAKAAASRAALHILATMVVAAGPLWVFCWADADRPLGIQTVAWWVRGIPDYILGDCYPWFNLYSGYGWPVHLGDLGIIVVTLALGGITVAATLAFASYLAVGRSSA